MNIPVSMGEAMARWPEHADNDNSSSRGTLEKERSRLGEKVGQREALCVSRLCVYTLVFFVDNFASST